ncbi:hypothetical protein B0H16DRAFT_1885888 [Mycena metata]|uniref:Uncharacterized protein n=1 Tax=Mycena metata TaxID=1033252 RepID=A0AAD7NDQ0_9AGAR|nr:hypothetical protein B0H16DRAFT_1885888 [Mycena metata]
MASGSWITQLVPVFPLELEREMAASSPVRRNILSLMLVAWRVKEWVEPHLYRVVSNGGHYSYFPVTPPDLWLAIDNTLKPAAFWSTSVKSLFLDHTPEKERTLDSVLTVCNGITRLFSHFPLHNHLDQLGSLRGLQRVSIGLVELFSPGAIDFSHPIFRNISHLELLDMPTPADAPELCIGLAVLPKLTHLAFNSPRLLHAMAPLMTQFTRLRCIVLLLPEPVRPKQVDISPGLSGDGRFVLIGQTNYSDDWMRGASGGEDYWDIAEAFIKARKTGTVDRSRFSICDADISWRSEL